MTSLALGVEIPDDQLARSVPTGFDRLPELLDDAGVGYVVLGGDRGTGATASLSPTLVGTFFARRTRGLGVVVSAAPQRDHPFNIARRTSALDHISGGRAGWLALRSDSALALGAAPHGTWAPSTTPTGPALLADAITAARALWRTWPIESLAADLQLGARPPEAEVRYADHEGVFATTGPLNAPTTPQGEPIVLWDYRFGDATHLAGADIAFVAAHEDLAAAAELPDQVDLHLRLDGADPHLPDRIAELAAAHTASGVLIRLDTAAVADFVEHTLPTLTDSVRLRDPDTTLTLRDHLGIARRPDPDPLRLRPVYVPA
ncbi:LLM class flavin-dependent oxidoreductase [Nocardia callitridis]